MKYGMRNRHCICKDLINKDIKKTRCKGKPDFPINLLLFVLPCGGSSINPFYVILTLTNIFLKSDLPICNKSLNRA